MQFEAENTDFFSADMQSPMTGASLAGDLLPGDYHDGVCCFRSQLFGCLSTADICFQGVPDQVQTRAGFQDHVYAFFILLSADGTHWEMIGWDVDLLFLCLVGMGGGLWVVGKKLLQVLEE